MNASQQRHQAHYLENTMKSMNLVLAGLMSLAFCTAAGAAPFAACFSIAFAIAGN